MGWYKEFRAELKARRDGRRFLSRGIHRSTRDITGPTGWVMSGTWKKLDQDGAAYLDSFDRRIPPSLHVSERDRTRHNLPIPLVERCIEDWGDEDSDEAASDEPAAGDGDQATDPSSG